MVPNPLIKFALLLLAALPAFGVTAVSCNNNSGDSALIQSAITTGGAITIANTCHMTGSVSSTTAFSITNGGSGVLTAASIGIYFAVNGNTQLMDGMTVNGVAIVMGCPSGILSGGNCGGATYTNVQTGVAFTNNTFQNYFGTSSDYSAAIQSFKIEKNFVFTGNTVQNVWYNDWANTNNSNKCTIGGIGICNNTNQSLLVHGILFWGGYDGMTIENNLFSEISGNAGKAFTNGNSSKTGGYTGAPISISYNVFQYIHRIAWEEQGADTTSHCTGGCGNSGIVSYEKVAGNLIYHLAYPWSQTYGWSLTINVGGVTGGPMTNAFASTQNQDIINNAVIGDLVSAAAPISSMGPAFEDNPGYSPVAPPPPGSRWVGNVASSDTIGGGGYDDWLYTYTNSTSPGRLYQNMVGCGPGGNTSTHNWLVSGGASKSWYIQQFNLFQSNCVNNAGSTITGAGLYTSGITSTHETDSPNTPSPGSTTFRFSEKSPNMPIKNVTYTVDASPVSSCTQEIQDVNSNFTTDLKWFYHCALVLSAYTTSSHTLVATATDLNGTTSTASTSFTGTGSGVAVGVSPSSLTFGSQTVSTTSSGQVVTLTNTGTGSVTISSIAFTTGTQYAKTTTCGGTLTMGSNCTVTVTFTPTSTGVKSDTLTFTTSATNPTVSITGTGVSGSTCTGSLLANCDFTSSTSGWTFQSGSGAVAFSVLSNGPGGIPAANFVASGTPVGNVELYQDGLTLVNGGIYILSGQIQSNRAQLLLDYPAILSVGPYTQYNLGPPVTPYAPNGSFKTFNFVFMVSGAPMAGSTRATLQFPNIANTDSLQLSYLKLVQVTSNICTPLQVATDGIHEPIVNGIDAVDWGIARVQWKVDASGGAPATYAKIQYATAAEWATNPTVYPHTQGLQGFFSQTDPTWIDGGVLPNLAPATLIHVIGQSSIDGGATYCTAPDETLTTLAYPGVTDPVLPDVVTNVSTVPTVTGTDYLYGSTCGTSGTVTARLQDCFNHAVPGDGIGIPPGLYNSGRVYPPGNPNAVAMTCTAGSSLCTSGGSVPSNGSHVRMDGFASVSGGSSIPSPLNPSYTYTVVNVSGSTFQLSNDGVNPITFLDAGGTSMTFEVWPLTQSYILVHSTAASTSLPPAGVRVDPVAYSAYYPELQANDIGGPLINWGLMSSYYWFQNIKFTLDPAIATTVLGKGVDPPALVAPIASVPSNDHIVFNQDIFDYGEPPNRTLGIFIDGSNIAFTNNYINGLNFWNDYRLIPLSVTTSTTIAVQAGSYYWVGSAGTKLSCTIASPKTLTVSGTGSFFVWIDPTGCVLTAQSQTGVSLSGSGYTILSAVSSPAYPTYNYTTPLGIVFTYNDSLKIGSGSVTSGTIGSWQDDGGLSGVTLESGYGLHGSSGPGPILVENNTIRGAGIVGVFLSDDQTNGNTPCGTVHPCSLAYSTRNLTERRNLETINPCFLQQSACWNGGNYSWRNYSENKQGSRVLQDGNIFGPMGGQVGQGVCTLHTEEYTGVIPTVVNYADASDWTYTNNTCHDLSAAWATIQSFIALAPGMPVRNAKLSNNLVYGFNGYQNVSPNLPLYAVLAYTPTTNLCPYGNLLQWGQAGQNFNLEHTTLYGLGGCRPMFLAEIATLQSGMTYRNNLLEFAGDPGYWNAELPAGSWYLSNQAIGGGTADVPNCQGDVGTVLFGCMTFFGWQGNALLGTYTNTFPGSVTEMSNSDIATAQALLPGNTYWPSSGTTLANRISQVAWYDPSNNNFRLKSTSPYISGAHPTTTDGLSIGVDMDALGKAQGSVQNVHVYSVTSTGFTVGLVAPDSFGCTVDWGLTNFPSGSGSWTRVANAGGARVQNVAITGVTAHSLVYYRTNCAVSQAAGTVQLP